MSYVPSTREDRGTLRNEIGRSSVQGGVGPLTYLMFAFSVGFAAAVVFGLVA